MLSGSSIGYQNREADVVIRREYRNGAVQPDVTVFGVKICDAIIGILYEEDLPRLSDGLLGVNYLNHRV